jgi:flagellin
MADSNSRIVDTDYAKEMTEFARSQIVRQAGMAMLSQANAIPNQVLQLLQ